MSIPIRIPSGRLKPRGFTLIELLIAVSIIGILAAVAYPAYTQHVIRAKRNQATTAMMQGAQWAQRYYMAKNSFDGIKDAYKDTSNLTWAPVGVEEKDATYSISAEATPGGFKLTAEPKFTDSKCGKLTFDDTGKKGQESGTTAECWK